MTHVLDLLGLAPSDQSTDYVDNKRQFHLFNLLTEQRHRKTWNLSFAAQSDIKDGLRMLLSVDQDVTRKMAELGRDPGLLEQAAAAAVAAIQSGHKIYFYGCGATGRLAKQMESSFWRPFWRRAKSHSCWQRLKDRLPEDIGDRCVGEMTGADRALVSSLEGFEDLQLIGRLQLQDHCILRGDVVICVTEGGETSSVIGTILGALEQYGPLNDAVREEARNRLYFVYNNPDEVLRPFERSVSVLDNPAITKINLATGPQSITGSTRMQATTSETFVAGLILEETVERLLEAVSDPADRAALGFHTRSTLSQKLAGFAGVKAAVDESLPALSAFTRIETETYRRGQFATYFANQALITVFIDNTERSPTFRLYPLDRIQDPGRKCWLQVWTEASSAKEAWLNFLGRPFRGLSEAVYRGPFEEQVEDPYLREAALRSLKQAGNDQEMLYDFSFSGINVASRAPAAGDLGVAVLGDDELNSLSDPESAFSKFSSLCRSKHAAFVLVAAAERSLLQSARDAGQMADVYVPVFMDGQDDPLTLRRHMALKMLLNAHSTGIMAALGRVVGNTMTNVSPSNLKLIGRATFLILSHVNDALQQPQWRESGGADGPVSFAEANAVLFDAIDYVRSREMGQTAEVALSIVRILEALRRRGPVSWDEARSITEGEGLASFLLRLNPSLAAESRRD
jgi:N-acetylmuramic acid 6-phosphate etherase